MRIRHTAFPFVRLRAAPDIRAILVKHGKVRRIEKNACVVSAGSFYPNLGLVVDGLLSKSFEVKNSSKETAMGLVPADAVFGETWLMSRRASNLAVHAMRETMLIEVSHDCIETLMQSSSDLLRRFHNQFILNMETDFEGLATLIARSPEDCLRVLLKIFIVREGIEPQKCWYLVPVNLSHHEIAQIIYAAPLTINRIFLSWKKQGLYARKGSRRYIHRDLLVNISDWKNEEFLPGESEFADDCHARRERESSRTR
jgi:CRP-like cAMP-binding protein